jgi:hypothetical protein
VEADRQEGNRLGVDGTPFFFINGHAISGGVGLADFKKLIEAALKEAAGPNMIPVPGRQKPRRNSRGAFVLPRCRRTAPA